MVDKAQILHYIAELARTKAISKDELVSAYESGSGEKHQQSKMSRLVKIFYYIGGIILAIGITTLIAQEWPNYTFPIKVLITFGTGLLTYLGGIIFSKRTEASELGSALFFISALLLPIGLFILLDRVGLGEDSLLGKTLVSCLLFGLYMFTYVFIKKTVLVVLTLVFGTWLYFDLGNYLFKEYEYYRQRAMLAGVIHIMLGRAFVHSRQTILTKYLYTFGLITILGSAFALSMEFKTWEYLYPFLLIVTFYLSAQLKSRIFSLMGGLFMITYLCQLTWRYFADSIGWPIALMFVGFIVIATGYLSLHINRKYISKTT